MSEAIKDAIEIEPCTFGKLKVLLSHDAAWLCDAYPVRAFALKRALTHIALMAADGRELYWIDDLKNLSENNQHAVKSALAQREFMPTIQEITAVSTFACPSTWTVKTDRGTTTFILKGEEDIRRIANEESLLITDIHGIHYRIDNPLKLPASSQKLLTRFR